MKTTYLLLLLVLFASSCAPKKVSEAKFSLSIDSLVGTSATASFPGGLIIYGKASNGDAFGRIVTVDNLTETLPNGIWNFYLLGWDDNAGEKLSGKVYCGKAMGVNLDGTATIVNVDMANGNCSDAIWGPSFTTGSPSEIKFVSANVDFKIHSCNEKGFASASINTDFCKYAPLAGNANYKNNQGFAQSYQVFVKSFDQFAGVFKFNTEVYNSDPNLGVVTNNTNAYYANIANMNFPLGGSLEAPFAVEVRAYYDDTNGSTKGYKSILLKNGLATNTPNSKGFFDNTINKFHLFTKVGEADVCQSPRLASGDFAAGNGALFPYVICNADQLQQASDLSVTAASSNYILASDIDLEGYFDPYGDLVNTIRHKDDPMATFTPFGYNDVAASTVFTGTFDGAGHVIKNMFIAHSSSEGIGFISSLGSTGKVLNTKFDNLKISGESSSDYVGGIAGKSNGIIDHIIINDLEIRGNNMLGGIIGEQLDGTLSRVFINKLKMKGYDQMGGFVGKRSGGGTSNISNSVIESLDMRSYEYNTTMLGSIVGNNRLDLQSLNISTTGFIEYGDNLNSVGGRCGISHNGSNSVNCLGTTNEDLALFEKANLYMNHYNTTACGTNDPVVCVNTDFPQFKTNTICDSVWINTNTYQSVSNQVNAGKGIASNPVIICNASMLVELISLTGTQHAVLGRSIRWTNSSMVPSFEDVLNGNGHILILDGIAGNMGNIIDSASTNSKLSNISIVSSMTGTSVGSIFGTNNGELKNLNIFNIQNMSGSSGAIAPFVQTNNGDIENVRIGGAINFSVPFSGTSVSGAVSNNTGNIIGMSVENSINSNFNISASWVGGVVGENSGIIDQAVYKGRMMFSGTGNNFSGGGIVGTNTSTGTITNVMTESYSSIEVNNSSNGAFFAGLAATNNGSINYGISMMSMKFLNNITNMYPLRKQGIGPMNNVYGDEFAQVINSGWDSFTCSYSNPNFSISFTNNISLPYSFTLTNLTEALRIQSNDAILDIVGTGSALSTYSTSLPEEFGCEFVSIRKKFTTGDVGDTLATIEDVNSYTNWDIGFLNFDNATGDITGDINVTKHDKIINFFEADMFKQEIPSDTPIWVRHDDRKIPRLLRFDK